MNAFWRTLGCWLPILVTTAGLAIIDSQVEYERPVLERPVEPKPQDTRLVVFWIDSLAREDMDNPALLPRLKARIQRGALHGPTRACADALSEPCTTAMASGVDRFSLFLLVKKLAHAGGAPEGSLFHVLQQDGRRLGFAGDWRMNSVVSGFDWTFLAKEQTDTEIMAAAMGALEQERLNLLLVQLRKADEVSHKHGPADPRYAETINLHDRWIDEAIDKHLRPDDHFVVLGDHGHTDDGRHFAGLDVPTYMAYFGPMFSRDRYQPNLMTDHAQLWARVFGYRFGEKPWVTTYFAGGPLSEVTDLPEATSGWMGLPTFAFLIVVVLALMLGLWWPIRAWRGGKGGRVEIALGVGALLLGMALYGGFHAIRPFVYHRSDLFNTGVATATGLLGLGLGLAALRQRVRPLVLFQIGTVLFALPTIYKFGSIYVAMTGLSFVVGWAAIERLRERQWQAAWMPLLFIGLLQTLSHPKLSNFKINMFRIYDRTGDLRILTCILFTGLAVYLARDRERSNARWFAGAAAGLALGFAGPWLPPHLFILPCVAAFPLTLWALRDDRIAPLALFASVAAFGFFHQFSLDPVTPIAASILLWALWARARARDASIVEGGVSLVVLTAVCLWASFGARLPGLNFNYFFAWLPKDAMVDDTQLQNALLTTTKYLLIPTWGLLFARRAAGTERIDRFVWAGWQIARLKLAVVLAGLAAFAMWGAGGFGPFIIADAYQDAAIWTIVLMFLSMVGGGALFPGRWPIAPKFPGPP